MYTLDEFMTAVDQSDGVVCYGIGKRFHMFLCEFEGTSIIDKIKFCIDAYAKDNMIKIENRLIEVQGISSLQTVRDNNYVLVITNLRYDQVVDDLKNKDLLQGIQVFCFTHLYGMLLEERAMNKWVPANLRITKEQRIPKVIHYCWFGGNPIPDKYKKWIRENLLPNTRMKCIAKYNGSVNCFDLVSIIDTSLGMKFGHYICPECGHDYGKKPDGDYCCICEGIDLKYIDNYYTES